MDPVEVNNKSLTPPQAINPVVIDHIDTRVVTKKSLIG